MTQASACSERPAIEQRLELLAAHGDQVAFSVDNDRGRTEWTARDLLARAHREARRLEQLGVARGDVVALLTGDDPITFVLRWAANIAGAAAVLIPDGFAPRVVAEILETCQARLLQVDAHRYDLGAAALEHQPAARSVRLIDVGAVAPPPDESPVAVRLQTNDLAWIRLTGGTTGTPKGIPRYATFMNNLSSGALAGLRGSTQLLCTPVAHLAGTIAEVVVAAGGRVLLQAPFDPGRALAAIERERITSISLVPRLLHQLLDHPDLPLIDTSSLQTITLGSAPISAHRLTQAIERFGPVFSVGYGTLEVTSITSLSAEELRNPALRSTVGRPLPNVAVSLRDEQSVEVATGEVGEVWVRSEAVMPGYVNAPEQTAAAMHDDWFRTGDLARLDDQGYLTLVGRTRDVIIAEHAHVYPEEVEDALLRHPGVAAAAVVGVEDIDHVESPVAAVVPREGGQPPAPKELIDWVERERGSRVAPTRVHLVSELPTTPSAKVDKRALRDRLAALSKHEQPPSQ